MTLGMNTQSKEQPYHQYYHQWIEVRVGDATYAGRLAEIDPYNTLVLNPYLHFQIISGNLPRMTRIVKGRQTIVLATAPHVITPIRKKDVEALIDESGRDFLLAAKRREEELKKYGLEHKIQKREFRQLVFQFPE